MEPYLITAVVATFLTYLGSKYDKHRNRVVAVALYALAVFILCNLAARRDLTVGTDTISYTDDYLYVLDKDFSTIYSEDTRFYKMEYLYKIVVWVSANIFHSSYYFFFIMALITVTTLFVALRLINIEAMPLGIFLFSIFFFPMSFNVMRQYCAMSFVMLSYVFIRDKKLLPLLLSTLLAYGFHTSSILCPVIIFIFLRLGTSDGKYKQLKIICSILAIVLGVLVMPRLLPSLLSDDNPYAHYLNSLTMKGGGLRRTFYELFIFYCGLTLLNILLTHGSSDKKSSDTVPLFLISTMGVISYGLCLYSAWLYRFSLYFLIFLVPLFPIASNNIATKQDRIFFQILCIAIILCFCYGYFIVRGSDGIYPYSRAILYY